MVKDPAIGSLREVAGAASSPCRERKEWWVMEYSNLGEAYRTVCRRHADRILFRHREITFGQCWRRTEALALFLRREGHKKGDIIAILAGNSPEWCIAYMAVTAIGAIALPLDTNLGPDQYREMIRAVGARAAFVS